MTAKGLVMIEIIEGFPDTVVAFAARGRVSKQDYERVVVPKVEEAISRHDKLRCYYELGEAFSGMDAGAMWEDLKIGFGHLSRWERIAVVTDADWIRHAVNAFRFLMPGQVRVFGNREKPEARAWLVA